MILIETEASDSLTMDDFNVDTEAFDSLTSFIRMILMLRQKLLKV